MKTVSMVVPCYNKVEYIGEFFQSVYDQVWDNIELILVNDGSTDGTREIIGQWEERFIDRGYSVRIVDQENLGVSAAVKAGLECVTGDFFCMPDCDDVLHPEYVSKMAGILIENEDIVRVACDLSTGNYVIGNVNGLKMNYYSELRRLEFDLIGGFALGRVLASVCQCMLRSSCLRQLIDAYKVDCRNSQEPQGLVALGYIEKTVHLPETLYFHRRSGPGCGAIVKDYITCCDFFNDYYDVMERAIKLLPISVHFRDRLLCCAQLGRIIILAIKAIQYEQTVKEMTGDILTIIEQLDIPLKNRIRTLENNRWLALGRTVSNYIIGYDNPFHGGKYIPNKQGRIIGYGAYNAAARDLLPLAIDSPLKPDVLWDKADGASHVMGIPVEKPDIAGLTPDDMVLVFIRKRETATEVYDLLEPSRTDNIMYYYDVLDYLADFYFPLEDGAVN